MKFSLWTNYGATNSKPVFEAFAKSLISAGHTVVYNEKGADKDVIWSVLWKGRMAPNKTIFNSNTIVLEVGSLRRGITWKVAIGGINRAAQFGTMGNSNKRVYKLGLQLEPWVLNKTGPIVICCQNPHSMQWAGNFTTEQWLSQVINEIRFETSRKIIIRAHPRALISNVSSNFKNVEFSIPQSIPKTYDSFDFSPHDAWAVVNATSGPGVQSAIAGTPVFVELESLAWDVANHTFATIEQPLMPDRTQWLNDISYTEWTIDEIETGEPLDRLTLYL